MPLEGTSQKMKEAVINTNPITHHTPNKNKLSSRGRSRSQKNLNDEKTEKKESVPLPKLLYPIIRHFPKQIQIKIKKITK